MIHVDPQPEPASFDVDVRQKGNAWLVKNGFDHTLPLPSGTHPPAYWRACLDDLYSSYNQCCAYLSVFFERTTGGATADHFIAKTQRADLIYEWKNYRLASSIMNSRKRVYEDVLDPFEIETGWFQLELVSGRIFPNPQIQQDTKNAVQATINRLGLDDPRNREMRARHYQEFTKELYTEAFLKIRSPFVWHEANRQNLL